MDVASITLGFVTILNDVNGYLGGYLITNGWGRPLEFRLTSPVQPTKVQQLLYGKTLKPYLFSEVIGKTLIEKATVQPNVILTNVTEALELRSQVTMPVACLINGKTELNEATEVIRRNENVVLTHSRFDSEVTRIREIMLSIESVDLFEPFQRIEEAIIETRRHGSFRKVA